MSASLWKIVGSSIKGKAHIESQTPCQDAHGFKLVGDSKGVAVVSDGAGSHSNSHLGSGFVVEKTIEQMAERLQKSQWLDKDYRMEEEEWRTHMLDHIDFLQQGLQEFAERESLDYRSLSCTFIVLLFSPHRILTCHVGDGRAGYSDEKGNWKSLFKPFKGEQVGQTVFITSSLLDSHEDLIETDVVDDEVRSFTLLSDGCELACWECYDKRQGEESYYDPNLPFPKFFNPCVEALRSMYSSGLSDEQITAKWDAFLDNGNAALQKETDDKTMILGTLVI